jgi:two-component system, NarL family, nitrate/nitrite response regulator NarL
VQNTQPLHRAIRVLVADSSPITSQLLAEAIRKHRGIEIVGFGSDPQDIFDRILNHMSDVALISARLGDDPDGGFSLLQKLRSERPSLRAVILLDCSGSDRVVRAFRSGASGVFSKNLAINTLCKCIVAVHEGQIWANSQELGFVLAALTATPQYHIAENGALAQLSKREQEVVQSLADGLTNRQIADRLKISPHTVKNYMFKIFDKLGVSSRVELLSQVLSGASDSKQTDSNIFAFRPNKESGERAEPKPTESIAEVPRRMPQYEIQSEKNRSPVAGLA